MPHWRSVLLAGFLLFAGAAPPGNTAPGNAALGNPGLGADPPQAVLGPDGREHLRLDVMIYNIEGLPSPVRHGRGHELSELGRDLEAMQKAGQAPDLILFQEVFSHKAKAAVKAAGYPEEARGPSMFARRDLPSDGRVAGRRAWLRGELPFKLESGGLAVVSRYPILARDAQPFSRKSCAGTDCLANKGALFVRIAIPGAPTPLDVFDSHMNARRISRAPLAETLVAHNIEARELADFVAQRRDPQNPVLLGGDFNMRHSEARFRVFEQAEPLTVVQRYCAQDPRDCASRIAWTDDTPWLDTEDLQLFGPGAQVDIRPIQVETLFDGAAGGPMLSDHAAVRVIYDVSWPAAGSQGARRG